MYSTIVIYSRLFVNTPNTGERSNSIADDDLTPPVNHCRLRNLACQSLSMTNRVAMAVGVTFLKNVVRPDQQLEAIPREEFGRNVGSPTFSEPLLDVRFYAGV